MTGDIPANYVTRCFAIAALAVTPTDGRGRTNLLRLPGIILRLLNYENQTMTRCIDTDVIIEMQQTIDQLRQRAEAAEKQRDDIHRAFDLLCQHIADKMPVSVRILKLAGCSTVDALKDYEFVPKGIIQERDQLKAKAQALVEALETIVAVGCCDCDEDKEVAPCPFCECEKAIKQWEASFPPAA